MFLEVNGADTRSYCHDQKACIECLAEESKRIFIMEVAVHCADISNTTKPFDIGKRWSDLVCEEFCLQGDREKAEGLEVSPMMDRDQINLPNMQLGFMEFVVAPIFTGLW
jgi:hypothetical protein